MPPDLKLGLKTFIGGDPLDDAVLNACVPHLSLKPDYNWAFRYNEFGERVLVDGFTLSKLDKTTQGECRAIFLSQDIGPSEEYDAAEQAFYDSLSPIIYAVGMLAFFERFASSPPTELTEAQVEEYLRNWSWLRERDFAIFGKINVFDLVSALSQKLKIDPKFRYVQQFEIDDARSVTLKVLAEDQGGRTVINMLLEGTEQLKVVKSADLARPSFLIVAVDVVFTHVVIDAAKLRNDRNVIKNASHTFMDKLYGYEQCISRLVPELGAKGPFTPSIETSVLFSNGTKSLGGHETLQLKVTYLDLSGDVIHTVTFRKDIDDKLVASSGGAHEVADREVHTGSYADIFNIAEARLEWSWPTADAQPGPMITIIDFTF